MPEGTEPLQSVRGPRLTGARARTVDDDPAVVALVVGGDVFAGEDLGHDCS